MISIIIPTYNEEEVIASTLNSLTQKVKTKHEILVVDDSSDSTELVVKKYARRHKNIKFVKNNPEKKGFALSIKKGIKESKYPVVVVVMGDLCDDPNTIDKMYKRINSGYDVVCGSRYMKGGKKSGGPKVQHFLSLFVCTTLHHLTGIPTTDPSNAYKMYKKTALKGVKFNPASGVEASIETIFQVYFKGVKITEVPTSWTGRTKGDSKFRIFQRAPKYAQIYKWALIHSLKIRLGLTPGRFYA